MSTIPAPLPRLPAQGATSSSSAANSPLTEYLRDPAGALHALLAHFQHWALTWGLLVGPAVAALAAGLVWARWWWRRRCRHQLAEDARLVQILPPPTVDAEGAAALWANLVGLLRPAWRRMVTGQPHLAFEYVFDRETVHLQVWVPGVIPPGMIERAVESAWPGAHTRTTPATAPLPCTAPNGQQLLAAGGELRLGRPEALPLRTEFPADPIRALLGAPVGLGPREQAVVQVLARPVAGRRVTRARRAARRLRAGQSPRLVSGLLDLATPGHHPRSRSRSRTGGPVLDRQTTLAISAEDRVIVAKQRGAPYDTRVRYGITATVPATASQAECTRASEQLRGRGHAIASAFAAFTEHNYYRRARTRSRRLVPLLAERRLDDGDLLSVAELAALAHLPWDETVPGLQRAGARAVPPPPGVPASGAGVRPIGRTSGGHPRPVALRVPDARQHLHILGATGSGKSELMARMILADAEAGRGAVVVDPKGDLVTDVLMRLPEELGEKVVLFDADSKSRPPILNPLEGTDPARSVDQLTSIFSRIYAASWGPRTDDILRAGLLTLRAQPGTPLLSDLPRLLTDAAFRHRATSRLGPEDDILKGFWSWYGDLSDAARAQVTAPLMNKLRGVLLRPFVRAALADGPSTVEMGQVLDGGICLVRIAQDALGAETAHLIGSIIVARTWQAATARARTPQDRRRDCGLYIDEAHNFLHLPYPLGDMLAEARAYRLSLTLAHQYLRQLPKELEEGISTNARTKILFNASPEDARHLARHTEPRLTAHDLSHLDAFHAAVRPVLHGAEAPAFTAVTEKLPPPIPGRAKAIRAAAARNARHRPGRVPLSKNRDRSAHADPRRTR
ncbi:ATP-binding protein [Streptomyces armeniacus]|uniref:ATP-binding protein n=1 Tax=Streptomyces armeniacus TaxID=83291 RepID=A0A345XVX9_9ACTN|nr:type IV secretion system DNA-binding domain-containing protein [Streptomyces armeniacus]AXK35795.1 ATP-binding protein [Streptomyces armeniacus]